MTALDDSYAHCQRIARRAARNFYYSFWLLPRPKRRAMCALYAFLRITDDLVDDDAGSGSVAHRRRALERWRARLVDALAGRSCDPIFPALADTVARYQIPPDCLLAAIDGVAADLEPAGFATWEELKAYCYRVASVVGLACVHIWGFTDRRALSAAETCGLAFQLTNILRDLKEDAHRGRIYLPREDLERFAYPPEDLAQGVRDGRFRALMTFEIARAEALYCEGSRITRWLERDGRIAFTALARTYHEVLAEIKRRDGDVFTRRVGVRPWRKLWIALDALARPTRDVAGSWEPAP